MTPESTRTGTVGPQREPLLSVVISGGAAPEELSRTLASLASQTWPSFEVVVCGDVPAIDAEAVRGRPLRFIGTAPDGLTTRRILAETRGRHICLLRPGDVLDPTYLEKCLCLLESEELDLCESWCRIGPEGIVHKRPSWWPHSFPSDGNGAPVIQRAWLESTETVRIGRPTWLATAPRRRAMIWEPLVRLAPARGGRLYTLDTGAVVRFILSHPSVQQRRHAVPARGWNGLTNAFVRRTDGARHVLVCLPFLSLGGVETVMSRMCAALQGAEFKFHVLVESTVSEQLGDATDWFRESTADIFCLSSFLRLSSWLSFVLYLIETRGIDLICLAGPPRVYGMLPAVRANFPSVRVVDHLFNEIGHTARNRDYNYCIDSNIVENQKVRLWLRDHGEEEQRILVVPNTVDIRTFTPQPRRPLEMEGQTVDTESRLVVGYLGRFAHEKAPDLFLDIAERLQAEPDILYAMAGLGPLHAQIGARIRDSVLRARILLSGPVEARRFLSACDVLVVPSRMDGRPNVVLESLAMGIPVVASRLGGLPELVRDGETGYLCPVGDVAAFAERIAALAHDRALLARMRTAARAFAEEQFASCSAADACGNAFRRLLAPPAAPLRAGEPRVSVLMPVHNAAATLGASIESVLSQTMPDFEFIIIDDGSTDDSPAILRSFAERDDRIRAVYHAANGGITRRLNEGLQMARCRWIARMDADDECLPDRLRVQLLFVTGRTSLAAAGSFVYEMGRTRARDRLLMLPTTPDAIRKQLLKENCIWHPSVILDRDKVLAIGGYREPFRHAEDYDLWLRLSRRHDLANIPLPLLRYRFSVSGVSLSGKWDQLYGTLLAQAAHRHPRALPAALQRRAEKRLRRIDRPAFMTAVADGLARHLAALGLSDDLQNLLQRFEAEIGDAAAERIRKRTETASIPAPDPRRWYVPADILADYAREFQRPNPKDVDQFSGLEITRRDLLIDLLRTVPLSDGAAILDAGCGQGRYLEVLHHQFPATRLAGCDVSAVAIDKARLRVPEADLHVMADERFPFDDASFDLVLSVEVMEHVGDLPAYLAQLARVLKPGGHLAFTTPCANRFSFEWLWAHLHRGGVRATPDGFRRWFYEDPAHLRRLQSREAEHLLLAAGLERKEFRFWCHLFSSLLWMAESKLQCAVPPGERIVHRAGRYVCHAGLRLLASIRGLARLGGTWFRYWPQGATMFGLFRKRASRGAP